MIVLWRWAAIPAGKMAKQFRFGYYGDDFTGSTDALEALSRGGVKTLLFLGLPDERAESLAKEFDAIGMAGTTRSMRKEDIQKEVTQAFGWFSKFSFEHIHYKVCSTLDSSPDYGNIGVAIEAGQKMFNTSWVPFLVGTPDLGRWIAFGQLFARDRDGRIYRLDRHPTMRRHPVTPMDEADVGRHLAKQTSQPMVCFQLPDLRETEEIQRSRLESMISEDPYGIVIFDTVDHADLKQCGNHLRWIASQFGPFTAGSSAVESAYVLSGDKRDERAMPVNNLGSVSPLLVVSGSASPKTQSQIQYGREQGWEILSMEPWNWFRGEDENTVLSGIVERAEEALRRGQDVVLCTCEGPDDPAINRTKEAAQEAGWENPLHWIGKLQGKALRKILESVALKRVCIAGGDTSGYVASELGIYALEFGARIDPGAPLCIARSHVFDGLQISLKGGQVGSTDYFERVKEGGR